MRRRDANPPEWHLATTEPKARTNFQRWDIVIILSLGLLVLGVFVAAAASTGLF